MVRQLKWCRCCGRRKDEHPFGDPALSMGMCAIFMAYEEETDEARGEEERRRMSFPDDIT